MKKALVAALLGLSVVACPILYFYVGPALDQGQLNVLYLLLIIMGASALYCFAIGEITHNNSQMDKLWSLLPETYLWIIAAKGGMSPRLIVMASLATLWGIRLTINFARKGAYHLKFWEGKEDYRWKVLREKKEFQPRWKWTLFNLFFISLYQNLLVLLITIPALASMHSTLAFGWIDYLAAGLMAAFLLYETIADEQQWHFQSKKWSLIQSGKSLAELPGPFNRGFNTTGLWAYSRHPNYLGEQGIWLSFYLFSIGAGIGIFNWSIIGALLLIVLFLGSSSFAEEISAAKYPEYALYKKQVSRFFPWKKYQGPSETTK
jgi:steroid 5-alpha reductase family enzyme